MKVTYPAIFIPDADSETIRVFFPGLDYEEEFPDPIEDVIKHASQALGFALWMLEDANEPWPNPDEIEIEDVPAGGYIRPVTCDYDEYKANTNVRVIDLS